MTVIDIEYEIIEPPSQRAWWIAALALGVSWFVYAIPWLFQGMVIPWDAKDFYYPMLRFLAASLAQGEPGQWNPYLYGGFPAIADPQSWYFSPTFRLLAALDGAPSMQAVDAMQLLHLLVGAIGLLLLCRRLGLRAEAATLAGLVFMFGGVAASRLQHSLMIVSYAWLPWSLLLLTLACESPVRHRRLLAAAGFGIVAGLMAIDRDQVAYLSCLLLIGIAAWQVGRCLWPRPIVALRRALELMPAVLTGTVVLAVPMLLTLDLLTMSTRPEIDFISAGNASLQPASFLTLLHADLYGSLRNGGYWGPGQPQWADLSALGFDWTDETVSQLYIGMVPLALLAVGSAIRKPGDPYRRAFVAAFAASVLYAIGAHTPVFRLIYDWVPGVDLYRRPNDAAFLVNFGFAMLVGFAAHAVFARDAEWTMSKLKFVLVGFCLLAVTLVALWIGAIFDRPDDALHAVLFAVPALSGLAFVIAWGRRKLPSAAFAAALVVLTAGDLIWRHSGAVFNAHRAETIIAYRPADAAVAAEIRARLGTGPDRGRAEIFGLGGSWQNAALVYRIEQTLGYNPLRGSAYEAATGSQQNNHLPERALTEAFTGYDSSLAKSLGIRIVASGAPIDTILPPGAYKSLTFLGPRGNAYLYENTAASPRVIVAPLTRTEDATADSGSRVTIADSGAQAPIGAAEIITYRQSQVMVRVRMDTQGLLVLHDLYHPAWQVSVDGRPAAVLRANELFRAVALAAGEHIVTFSFEPLSWSSLVESATRVAKAYGGD